MIMRKGVAEIVKDVCSVSNPNEKIQLLRQYNSNTVLKTLLRMAVDENLKWLIPPGIPTFKANEYTDQQGMLYGEAKRLYLFYEGGGATNLKPAKREMLFIQLLECLDVEDARFLLRVKDRALPEGINKQIIQEAFPGLI